MSLTFNPAAPSAAPAAGGGTTEKKDFPVIPKDTVLDVEIKRCELRQVDKARTPWKTADQEVVFAFESRNEGEFKKRWLWLDVPAVLDNSPNCKLRLYLQSILGIDSLAEAFPGGLDFDPDDYVGMDCQVRVGTYFSKKKQTIENCVDDVLPASVSATGTTFSEEVF